MLFWPTALKLAVLLMPCLHETRLREVNAFHNINVNVPRVNVSRVNTA